MSSSSSSSFSISKAAGVPLLLPSACGFCKAKGADRACGGCRVALFCDVKCQHSAWKYHKSACRHLCDAEVNSADAFSCGLCDARFLPSGPSVPLTLPCGHIWCKSCLSQSGREGQATCPKCDHPYSYNGNGKVLPVSENLLELASSLAPKGKKTGPVEAQLEIVAMLCRQKADLVAKLASVDVQLGKEQARLQCLESESGTSSSSSVWQNGASEMKGESDARRNSGSSSVVGSNRYGGGGGGIGASLSVPAAAPVVNEWQQRSPSFSRVQHSEREEEDEWHRDQQPDAQNWGDSQWDRDRRGRSSYDSDSESQGEWQRGNASVGSAEGILGQDTSSGPKPKMLDLSSKHQTANDAGSAMLDPGTTIDLRSLLTKWRSNPDVINFRDKKGNTAFLNHCAYGRLNYAKLMLEMAPCTNINVANDFKLTALHRAAYNGKIGVIEWLIMLPGIVLDAKDSTGKTAVQQLGSNTSEIKALLLKALRDKK